MRLVIYKRDATGRLMEIENVKIVARLREYLNSDGNITEKGIKYLIHTLLSFQEVTRYHRIKEVKCVATASIRQAKNQRQIQKEVAKWTDFTIRILSEYEEAFYGFYAVMNSFQIDEAITIDIGGGSTEITYFKNRDLKHYHSFPFGALSLKKQFVRGDVPTPEEILEIGMFIENNLQTLKWLANKSVPVIAIGGSARNMAQIHQSLCKYPLNDIHQYEMDLIDIRTVKEMIGQLTYQQLLKVEGLSSDRADIIIPAVEVFEKLVEVTSSPRFILSRKGLRDGIFYKELAMPNGSKNFKDVIDQSLYHIAKDYQINQKQADQLTKIATSIFKQLKESQQVEFTEKDFNFLKKAASIFNFGEYVSHEASSEHTFYLLSNRMIDGMNHRDRITLALIASYKKKDSFLQFAKPYQAWFSKAEFKKMRMLGAILKFSYSLNSTKRNIVESVKLRKEADTLLIKVKCKKDSKPEEYQANKQKKHLEKVLKQNIQIIFS
ncbi:Ppx/GppA family phosphatase [Bacillus sp. DNRA2]|uniref:Ppx/GppA family phosphatase n=1 Tax=Bacillus sp. DNRA2 TaxID=2723053 RepID=UPI00145C4B79|nr:Ppx/GppA family phosphatase [Bacillus sp. DNRA2]NMD69829.1 Ppx/GppA family phosphatase [Bacillus sp. DNRA2]